MADMYESRDAAKRRLRSGVIEGSGGEGRARPSLLVYIAGIFGLAVITLIIWRLFSGAVSDTYTVDWSHSGESEQGYVGYTAFDGGIIRITKDGAEYLDGSGSFIWDRSYQMSSPIVDASADFAVIADQGATRMYIFDSEGLTGVLDTLLPISLVRVSDAGVVYALLHDTAAEYITAFRSDGTALDLSVKSILTGDGYPFDIDVSPDGTELITSYVSVTDGELCNSVVFRNFSSIGASEDARRVVGGFTDEFEGHLVGRVHFSDDSYSQAFYDGGVVFFSTKVLNSPEILSHQVIPGEIASIATGETIAAVLAAGVPDEETGEIPSPYELGIYSVSTGSLRGSVDIDMAPDGLLISGDAVALYFDDEIRVFSERGALRADFHFDEGGIDCVAATGRAGSLYVVSAETIYRISF